jgi:hypothetical protein
MNNVISLNEKRWNVNWIIEDLEDEFYENGTKVIINWLIVNREEVGLSEDEIKELSINELKTLFINTSLKMMGIRNGL